MVAGSILPITIHNNEVLFLFGKENEFEDSAKGWSDFGGRCDNNETPFQAALREGGEELTGFLGDSTMIHQMIRKNGGTYDIIHNGYHVHIFYIDYDEKLPEYYNQNHRFLWDRMDKKILSQTKLFEKIEIKWFSLNEMKQQKKGFRSFYQDIINIFIKDISKIKKFIERKSTGKKSTNKSTNKSTRKSIR